MNKPRYGTRTRRRKYQIRKAKELKALELVELKVTYLKTLNAE